MAADVSDNVMPIKITVYPVNVGNILDKGCFHLLAITPHHPYLTYNTLMLELNIFVNLSQRIFFCVWI